MCHFLCFVNWLSRGKPDLKSYHFLFVFPYGGAHVYLSLKPETVNAAAERFSNTEHQIPVLTLSLQTLMPDAAGRPLIPFKVQLYPWTAQMQERHVPVRKGTKVGLTTCQRQKG